MNRIIFPYAIRFQENGRIETFPAVDIFVYGKQGRGIRALFHVDSGATTSLMPAADAQALGLRLDAGRKLIVRGIARGAMLGYRHVVTIRVGVTKLEAAVIFVEYDAAPRILGREDVFLKFGILFDERKHRMVWMDAASDRNVIDRLFL